MIDYKFTKFLPNGLIGFQFEPYKILGKLVLKRDSSRYFRFNCRFLQLFSKLLLIQSVYPTQRTNPILTTTRTLIMIINIPRFRIMPKALIASKWKNLHNVLFFLTNMLKLIRPDLLIFQQHRSLIQTTPYTTQLINWPIS